MTFTDLKQAVETPFFFLYQIERLFPQEKPAHIHMQVSRFCRRGLIERLKRGVYLFLPIVMDEFSLGQILRAPSYVSLESALQTTGIIPDVSAAVTSVTPLLGKTYKTKLGVYNYHHLKKSLYFGFTSQTDTAKCVYYMADPEKALLDLIYLKKIKNLETYRFNWQGVNRNKLINYAHRFPPWVKDIVQ